MKMKTGNRQNTFGNTRMLFLKTIQIIVTYCILLFFGFAKMIMKWFRTKQYVVFRKAIMTFRISLKVFCKSFHAKYPIE